MATSDPALVFLVPGDPDQRTGGYGYVRALVAALRQRGWPVRVQGLSGQFPVADNEAFRAMDQHLQALPDHSTVVIDGLALGGLPEAIAPHRHRLTLLALIHHPLALETGLSEATRDHLFETERQGLSVVAHTITTSRRTADELGSYGVPAAAITVIPPGTARSDPPASRATSSATGKLELLCVGHLSPRKGQDLLLRALAPLAGRNWHLSLVGNTDRAPDFTAGLRAELASCTLSEQISITGEVDDAHLQRLWRGAHGFLLPSRYEGYGMVIDEALAYGLPILSSDGGALAETGDRPGIRQHPAGDYRVMREHIQQWLDTPDERLAQADSARSAARHLRDWSRAAVEFERLMAQLHRDRALFEADWLGLREPADHHARSERLTRRLADHCVARYPLLRVYDLGSGTGSNSRYLSPWLPVSQHWWLLEPDASLAPRCVLPSDHSITVEWHHQQTTAANLESLVPARVDLITGAALIDLMSAEWLQALAATAARRNAVVLMVLSYAGRFELDPADPRDSWLCETVNEHQHRDKGTGDAAGPDATSLLARALTAEGFHVFTDTSPWALDPSQSRLQQALIEGWCEAAREQVPTERSLIDAWQAQRNQQAHNGQLRIQVDHLDLLALPPWPGAS